MRTFDWRDEKRWLWRYFEVNGIERTQPEGRHGGRIDAGFPYANDADRLNGWLHDSLLWTIEMIEANELKLAFRGYVQAVGYAAETPNRGGSYVSDLLIGLRNYFEGVFEQTEVHNQHLEEVLADAREGQGLDVFLFEVTEVRRERVSAGVAGIVRARNAELARHAIREWLDRALASPQGEYRFRMFKPVRIDGVLVTTDFTPVYEGD